MGIFKLLINLHLNISHFHNPSWWNTDYISDNGYKHSEYFQEFHLIILPKCCIFPYFIRWQLLFTAFFWCLPFFLVSICSSFQWLPSNGIIDFVQQHFWQSPIMASPTEEKKGNVFTYMKTVIKALNDNQTMHK